MASKSQRRATRTHRRRASSRGLVRVEVQAPKRDADLIRALAGELRGGTAKAQTLRLTLATALMHPEVKTAFDIFGSELPDAAFTGASRVNGSGARLICEIPARHRDPQCRGN